MDDVEWFWLGETTWKRMQDDDDDDDDDDDVHQRYDE